MDSHPFETDSLRTVLPSYPVPAWLRPGKIGLAEPVFAAGAGLAALDRALRDAPRWSGVWMQRLRLQAAATACRHLGRPESEQALRDLWQLRSDGGAVGPAGAVLNAYQDLGRRDCLTGEILARVAIAFGNPQWDAAGLAHQIAAAMANAAPLEAAAIGATLAGQAGGKGSAGQLFALWVADRFRCKLFGNRELA